MTTEARKSPARSAILLAPVLVETLALPILVRSALASRSKLVPKPPGIGVWCPDARQRLGPTPQHRPRIAHQEPALLGRGGAFLKSGLRKSDMRVVGSRGRPCAAGAAPRQWSTDRVEVPAAVGGLRCAGTSVPIQETTRDTLGHETEDRKANRPCTTDRSGRHLQDTGHWLGERRAKTFARRGTGSSGLAAA